MITPLIHRVLTREDLARLVAEIGRLDQGEARAAEQAVQAGEVDAVLDSPAGTVAQAEGAAEVSALGLWWAGCFPARVTRRAAGRGMLRAYVTFAAQALALSARIFSTHGPGAPLWTRAADEAEALRAALAEARRDYLGRDVHSPESRLDRFLGRLN